MFIPTLCSLPLKKKKKRIKMSSLRLGAAKEIPVLRVCIRAVLINSLFLRIYPQSPSPENDDVAVILARRATLLKSLGFSNSSNDKAQGWDSLRHGERHKGASVCPRALEGC